MCFSATASFATAALAGLAGALCLTRVKQWGDAPLAATPLLFGLQQGLEGSLWKLLPHGPSAEATVLTYGYLFLAQTFWPIYAPTAALLYEPDPGRRKVMRACLVIGVTVGAWLFWTLVARPHHAVLACDHIVYDAADHSATSLLVGAGYLCAVSIPLLASSFRTVVVLGLIVLAGCAVSYLFYFAAFQSVWCYFAGAASILILGRFYWPPSSARSPRAAALPLTPNP